MHKYRYKMVFFLLTVLVLWRIGFFHDVVEGIYNSGNERDVGMAENTSFADGTYSEGELKAEDTPESPSISVNNVETDNQVLRVLLTNPDGGYIQSTFTLVCEAETQMFVSGEGNEFYLEEIAPGFQLNEVYLLELKEKYDLPEEALLFVGSQEEGGWNYEISFQVSLSGEAGITEAKTYQGVMGILLKENNVYILNELPLETYLCYVLPSEMPSDYPMEALKAQAICARTYAVIQMAGEQLDSYYADVDDTSGYQVYNSVGTTPRAIQAVWETAGEIICYEGEPIIAYYYSCSPGHSTTADIWKNNEGKDFPYLIYQEYGNLEAASPWFIWTYETEEIELEEMKNRMLRQCEAGLEYVTVWQEEEPLGHEEAVNAIENLRQITDMEIVERGSGDVVHILVICGEDSEGNQYEYSVEGEYSIRYILGNLSYLLTRGDGSTYTCDLVPSGFFEMELLHNQNEVSGYRLEGGGFGHGVGMSQHGAKYLAEEGYSAEEILTYYYENVTIEKVLEENG